MMTEAQKARVTADWSKIAGKPVKIEEVGGTVYGFSSELGVLRLFHKFNCESARIGYSENLKSWYFVLHD